VATMQVEFNKAALSLADSLGEDLKKLALNRLLKVPFLGFRVSRMESISVFVRV